ncbi:TIGR02186 family protein [Asticcacaulis sp. AND118]|uniref:TIGR02186 family protein n=1 Tax=Asticcacaulis sp. AND118 TaxID=2840468 RepID=UPI001D000C53|nr:TIGR02186 family protein [Asticcacaulis sp. AND118]UDF03844.1 TIGR02186 family protein [Asticcacaulis sp. AND118]
MVAASLPAEITAPAPAAPAPYIETQPAAGVSQELLSTDLTQNRIEVSSSFQGAKVILYGAVFQPDDEPSDVVVVIRGPQASMRLIRKVKAGAVWLNSRPVVFEGAPGYYMAASSQPLDRITDFSHRRLLGLGLDYIAMDTSRENKVVTRYGVKDVVVNGIEDDYLDWRRAVIRLKTKAGLYNDNPLGVRFVDRNLFRAEVTLPSEAPIGDYTAEVWLFRDGQPVGYSEKSLTVEKVGFERFIFNVAHRHAWLYGFACVVMSMGMGALASRLFRRG